MEAIAVRKRRPVQGGYARGEETRLRIIQTAIPLFARLGFDSASTREIASEAGVNPPALQYYFDSKEGLYRACAEYIADQASLAMDPVIEHAERLLQDKDAGGDAAIDCYCAILGGLADLLFCRPEAASWSPMLTREDAGLGQSIAMAVLRERFIDRFHAACTGLLARILGGSADSPEIVLRMMAINGQLKAFHLGRGPILACLGWSEFSPEHGRLIKSVVVDQTRALLTAEHRARAKTPLPSPL